MSRPLFTFLSNVLLSCPFALPKAKEYFVGISFFLNVSFCFTQGKRVGMGLLFQDMEIINKSVTFCFLCYLFLLFAFFEKW